MERWDRKIIFRCSQKDVAWYESLRIKFGFKYLSDVIRQALKDMATRQNLPRPITAAMSKSKKDDFPLTAWKSKNTSKKPVKPMKKARAKRVKLTLG